MVSVTLMPLKIFIINWIHDKSLLKPNVYVKIFPPILSRPVFDTMLRLKVCALSTSP
jgi:hypothetical protein